MKKWIALMLALVLVLSLTGCKSSDYKDAVAAMDKGQYAEAAAALELLGDYKDSAELLKKCQYTLATADYDSGNYEAAKSVFQSLGDYNDSAEYVNKCDYAMAVADYEAGEYESAQERFTALGTYSDSADYAVKSADALLMQKITGEWESNVLDLTSLMLISLDDELLCQALTDAGFNLGMSMTFSITDGSSECGFAYDDLDTMSTAFKAAMEKYMLYTWEANLAESNLTLEDLYNELGTSDVNEICEQLYGSSVEELMGGVDTMIELLDSISESLSFDFEVVIENGQITIDGDVLTYDEKTDTMTMEVPEEMKAIFGVDSISFTRK